MGWEAQAPITLKKSMEEQREKSEASRSSGDGDGRGMLPVFGGLVLVLTGLLGALVWWKRRGTSGELDDYVDPALVQTRIGDMAYQIEIDVTVIVKKDMGSQNSARMRMRGVIQAFKIFDRSLGSRLVVDGDIRPHTGTEDFLEFTKPEKKSGFFSFLNKEKDAESVIGLRRGRLDVAPADEARQVDCSGEEPFSRPWLRQER